MDDGVPAGLTSGQQIVNTLTIQVAEVAGADITTDDFGAPNDPLVQEDLFGTQLQTNTDGTTDFGLGYVVAAAIITVTKTADVISDPLGQVSPNANAIPGAVIEYTIVIANNGAATATADNVDLVDAIVANTTYVASSITLDTVGQTDAADFPGTDQCDSGGGATVTCFDIGPAGDLAAGESATVVFRVTID